MTTLPKIFTINIREHRGNSLPRVYYGDIGIPLSPIDEDDSDLHCDFDVGDITVSVFFHPDLNYDENPTGHIEFWNFITKKRISQFDYSATLMYDDKAIWKSYLR
jgi:hypothetical protein